MPDSEDRIYGSGLFAWQRRARARPAAAPAPVDVSVATLQELRDLVVDHENRPTRLRALEELLMRCAEAARGDEPDKPDKVPAD